MAVTYLDPIPELSGKKAKEFAEKMLNVKPIKLTEEKKEWLKTVKIGDQHIYPTSKK